MERVRRMARMESEQCCKIKQRDLYGTNRSFLKVDKGRIECNINLSKQTVFHSWDRTWMLTVYHRGILVVLSESSTGETYSTSGNFSSYVNFQDTCDISRVSTDNGIIGITGNRASAQGVCSDANDSVKTPIYVPSSNRNNFIQKRIINFN